MFITSKSVLSAHESDGIFNFSKIFDQFDPNEAPLENRYSPFLFSKIFKNEDNGYDNSYCRDVVRLPARYQNRPHIGVLHTRHGACH